ncbi:MAG: YHS domain-containing protein [Actinobacteria bacterium]|nr:YHS domain-containing protein [Actinomycetota bacterium]
MTVHTFIFADMSGFAALTEAHGDEAAADLAADFSAAVRPRLERRGAEEVKSIGDALMIRGEDAGESIGLGLEIVHEVGGQHRFPTIRVGMHTGPATEREGDWFGSTVNLAARIAGEAAGGEVLVSESTRSALARPERFNFRERGRVHLRNISEPALLFSVLRRGLLATGDLPLDPVCRMAIDPEGSAGSLEHRGTAYVFCSLACAERFAADPELYAGRPGAEHG